MKKGKICIKDWQRRRKFFVIETKVVIDGFRLQLKMRLVDLN